MNVCILQPSYIPWKGYFHQIQKADVFVFFDTVQYDRRGWRNRNKIKTPQGESWLTIPVHAHGTHQGLLIQDVEVSTMDWVDQHLTKLQLAYKKAPCFSQEFPWIEAMYHQAAQQAPSLCRITAEMTQALSARIGIKHTRFVFASQLGIESSDPTERLLKIVQAVGGTRYLSGPSAQHYMKTELFAEHQIPIDWMAYDYTEYPQLYPPFSHAVSILDLLLMVGAEEAAHFIWGQSICKQRDADAASLLSLRAEGVAISSVEHPERGAHHFTIANVQDRDSSRSGDCHAFGSQ